MALATFRETLVHAAGVRLAMTFITCRNSHVLISMAGCAGNLAVLGLARGQSCKDRIVA